MVFLLGNARTGEFESLRKQGGRVGVIRDVTSHGLCADDDAFDAVLLWNPADGVERLAHQLTTLRCAGVLNFRESYVEHHARLLAALGTATMSETHVARLRSKQHMRSVFSAVLGADSTGRHAPVTCPADVRAFGAQHGWPVVLKPEALYSSLFVTTVAGPDEVVNALTGMRRGIVEHVRGKGLPDRFARMQVEEYLSGSNHSVDLVVDADGVPHPTPVVDVLTSRDFGGEDFSHIARIAPSRVPAHVQMRMQQLACDAVRALDFRRCAAHVELVLTAEGPRLLEAAVRPGGTRIRMLAQAHGIDFPSAYLDVLRGRTPEVAARFDRPFAIVTPFPPGTAVSTASTVSNASPRCRRTARTRCTCRRALRSAGRPARVDSAEDVDAAWRWCTAGGAPPAIAEEFVAGQEYSVESLTLAGLSQVLMITEKETTGAPAFVETGHQMPARLNPGLQARIVNVVTELLRVIGHEWGPAHTEVMVSADGRPTIIETQTRFGGDPDLGDDAAADRGTARGRNRAGLLGRETVIAPRSVTGGAAIRFFAHSDAVVESVSGVVDARSAPGVARVDLRARPGQVLGPLRDSWSRQGYVLAYGDSTAHAIARAEHAAALVGFELSR